MRFPADDDCTRGGGSHGRAWYAARRASSYHARERADAPGDDGVGQGADVLVERAGGVVAAVVRVCRRNDRAPRAQARHDARLADADALLLHRLMDRHAVLQTPPHPKPDVESSSHMLLNAPRP